MTLFFVLKGLLPDTDALIVLAHSTVVFAFDLLGGSR